MRNLLRADELVPEWSVLVLCALAQALGLKQVVRQICDSLERRLDRCLDSGKRQRHSSLAPELGFEVELVVRQTCNDFAPRLDFEVEQVGDQTCSSIVDSETEFEVELLVRQPCSDLALEREFEVELLVRQPCSDLALERE